MSNTTIDTLTPLSPEHDPCYLVRSTLVGTEWRALMPYLDEHREYLKARLNEGKLLVAGPLQTTNGRLSGEGLYVLTVRTLAEATQIVENDPLHKAGIRQPEIFVWQRNTSLQAQSNI